MTRVMTVEEARSLLLGRVVRLGTERVDLLDSPGRVLAEDATSDIDVAPFDNSAMDGFAVRAADLTGASEENPAALDVVAHIGAGDWWDGEVAPGQAARIMTGAPVPAGADAVVMVEQTRAPGDGGVGSRVEFLKAPAVGEHIRYRGEEVRAGDVVIAAGETVSSAGVGLLASTGHATVDVYQRPRVAIIATGSELVEVDETPGRGKIRNSNSYSIAAQVVAAGGIPVRYPIVPDELDATREAFTRAAAETDFIVTSGGVSVGDFDYVKPVLEELGDLLFCKVAMRPGNPQTMGSISGVPFFGLPGNPTSTYVGFEIFVRPALRMMQGFTSLDRPVVTATLTHDVRKKQDRRYYLRGRLTAGEGGLEVGLTGSQSSALLTAAHLGNCFMVLPQGEATFPAGTRVACMRLDIEEGTVL
ncbi:MAG: molybdopterin molybdenumtransferase MoeA [Actinobacteria bacterium HGW-Actinobacteria-10]|jgi:molybdopterin molybdotransferase|nr:MAG: molybdopterin molybdenumtransferase MoeA [Actinobacteria bacterium HGW-Actinobacteria-10]